jgi:hypothetical protein
MKKTTYLLISAVAMMFVMLMASFSGGDNDSSGGAPGGYTNSPADGKNCSHCMGGTASAVDGWLTSDVPATGYVPGQTYTIQVVATGSGRKGFQVSPQTIAGNLVGTLTPGTGNKLVDSKYITHSSAVSTDATWLFQWQAPSAGAGDVTFYASRAIGKLNTSYTTLTIQQSTVGMDDAKMSDFRIFPNPVRNSTMMTVRLERPSDVSVELLDLRGARILTLLNSFLSAGTHSLPLNFQAPAGIYLLKMNAGGTVRTIKLSVTS